MFQGTPIPDFASINDPLFAARFQDLANAMILHGAKGKLVQWATGLSAKQVTERYQKLCNTKPPLGRNGQADPKSFALPSQHKSRKWNIQSAIFASVYEQLRDSMVEPVHKGWLLCTAYDSYVKLSNCDPADQIPFNNAYDIVNHTQCKHPPLRLHPCKECGCSFLVLTNAELDNQECPVCAVGKRCEHLINIGSNRAKKQAGDHNPS